MPTDITGTDVLEQDADTGQRRFRFVPGPVFTNVLLADEINRTPPKTQAALLQAMEEQRVTAGGVTHPIEAPYLVFATQNPIEQEGTYPLPEAQLDRFMLQIEVGYPDGAATSSRSCGARPRPSRPARAAVLTRPEILWLQELVRRVPVAPHVIEHAVRSCARRGPRTRRRRRSCATTSRFGAGPRASQALILGAKARAVLDGRFAAEIEDVRALCAPIMRHRLVMNFRGEAEGVPRDRACCEAILAGAARDERRRPARRCWTRRSSSASRTCACARGARSKACAPASTAARTAARA